MLKEEERRERRGRRKEEKGRWRKEGGRGEMVNYLSIVLRGCKNGGSAVVCLD